ncbi:unnamed protein product [Amaranthus hypochondriacus]
MAVFHKPLIFSIFFYLIIFLFVQAHQVQGAQGYYGGGLMDCGVACKARCSLASRQKMCLRACGTCCARCNCVPPGTSGNQDLCPCYATMTTHGGHLKCP